MRNSTLERKIAIVKTLAFSRITHLPSVTVLPNCTITQLSKIHKEFIWDHKRSKIKETILVKMIKRCRHFV